MFYGGPGVSEAGRYLCVCESLATCGPRPMAQQTLTAICLQTALQWREPGLPSRLCAAGGASAPWRSGAARRFYSAAVGGGRIRFGRDHSQLVLRLPIAPVVQKGGGRLLRSPKSQSVFLAHHTLSNLIL